MASAEASLRYKVELQFCARTVVSDTVPEGLALVRREVDARVVERAAVAVVRVSGL
jgi:hypothetical protein